jgi:hypothetical protein
MTITRHYRDRLRALLKPAEQRTFARLNTPDKIQKFIDALPINFCLKAWETMSPRRVLAERMAHCAEGALFAAAAFAYHGHPPLIIDLRANEYDDDHVLALFRERGLWGAISKTNHSTLRWRDPIYRTPRELVMSYAHEYCLDSGDKSLVAYSRPFPLTRYKPQQWVTAPENLDWLMDELDDYPHSQLAPTAALRKRRPTSDIEQRVMQIVEWPEPKRRAG